MDVSPEDENNLPAAINQSIYLMLIVPYLTLGVVGFLIWRGVRKNAAYRASLERAGVDLSPSVAADRPA